MLINLPNKKNITPGILFVHLCVWAILLLAGCGGGGIPVASVLTSGRITLSWNAVPGAASYDIYMSTSPGVTTRNSYKISDVTAPITITDLEPGTTYYFIVAVHSDTGESRRSKEVSSTIADTEGFIEFGDLIDHSQPAGTRDVTLAWDNVPAATSYNIYWSDKPGVTRRNGTKIDNAKNPQKLQGLVKGKKYYFVVTAVNQSGESSESEELSFTVGK